MRSSKTQNKEKISAEHGTARTETKGLSTIISARTGLTPADSSLMRTLPKEYADKTVGQALNYLLGQNLQDGEVPLGRSIEKEMGAGEFVVVVNGKNVELTEKLANYITIKEHKLPNNQVRPYNSLDIEVSAVQEGGNSRWY